MNTEAAEVIAAKSSALAQWKAMLRDDAALLAKPGAHHKSLLKHAHALHQDQLIDADDLGELLEFADAALAFAVESMLDIKSDE
jgi:hypothetical protein